MSSNEAHYAEVRAAYDRLASRYDAAVGWSPQAARAKAVALHETRRVTAPGQRLLDIGCGTGTEALMLARQGRRIHGIDLAPAMVEAARARAAAAGLDCAFSCLPAAAAGDAPGPFDGAYSFYGVLDLEPDLGAAIRGVARHLRPGAPFVVGLLNPTVLYELGLYPLLGRFKGYRKAFQEPVRLKVMAGGQDAVSCRLRTPRQLAAACRPLFEVERVAGIHFLAPPPRGPLLRLPRLVRAINRLEEPLAQRWPWTRLGYFSLATLRRTEAPA